MQFNNVKGAATNRNRRLQKEIQDVLKDTTSGITVTTPQGTTDFTDLTHFHGHFTGPADTPYEGGQYHVNIKITADYPFKPPDMRFITKIWHPNVSSQTGAICLDVLGRAWSPVLTLKSALMSLQCLLSSPEPKDPQDAEVASMLISRPEEFKHVAREWAITYANAPRAEAGSGRTGAESSGGMDDETLKKSRIAEETAARREAEQAAERAYQGYNHRMIDPFVEMGFPVERVVTAFDEIGLDNNEGEYYELDEELINEVTMRLFNEM